MIQEVLAVGFLGAMGLGAYNGVRHVRTPQEADMSGWLYFAAGRGTEVKVGVTQGEPTRFDLPDNPVPLRFLLKKQVPDTNMALTELDAEIGKYQSRNRWYDRDAAMYYIDHLKGLV